MSQSSNSTTTPICGPIVKSYGQYDSMTVSAGSGGGSDPKLNQGGSGGGYIYLQANTMKHNGTITADGNNSTNNGQKTSSGGGSGGTIFLMTYYLQGNGILSIKGGTCSNGDGGAGSGGRLKMLRFDW